MSFLSINRYNNKMNSPKKHKYIFAFDPVIKKRVPFIVKDGLAISLVTRHKFKYKSK